MWDSTKINTKKKKSSESNTVFSFWWVKRIYANIDTPQGKRSAVPGQRSKGALGGLQLKPRNGW